MKLLIKKLSQNAKMPEYKTPGSSGFDVSACIASPLTIAPSEVKLVPTGLSFQLPKGFEAQVRSRSGLALKSGVFVLNSPGTVDNDYRGEVSVILANFSKEPFTVEHGMRVAQVVIAQYQQFEVEEIAELNQTQRGVGGFGSTGLN